MKQIAPSGREMQYAEAQCMYMIQRIAFLYREIALAMASNNVF